MRDRTGLLLVNLGTPASPRRSDVRAYLREFLSDPRVIDLPAWRRRLILNLFILPFRPRRSAEAYAKIWTDRGSPLLFHAQDLTAEVRRRFGEQAAVEFAMRYGEPSIDSTLGRLQQMGIQRIVVFPLYPQYSAATTGSTLAEVFTSASRLWNVPQLQVVPPFYDHPRFIEALAEVARPHLSRERTERVFFSFHGLPQRQIRKSDPSGAHCLTGADCCRAIVEANRNCYRAQCCATARLLAERLEIPDERRIICFQSRLGRDPWIGPFTDQLIGEEARRGAKRAAILSPSFVADCLETLEELGIRATASFRENGGERLQLVPCLNSNESWVDALIEIACQHSSWLDRARA